jgi:elongation factor Ts
VTADGAIGSYGAPDAKVGALVEVNAETDFVAKNPDFIEFAQGVAKLVAEAKPADVAALSALPLGAETVESARQKLVQKIGENIAVRRFERIEAAGKLVPYVHPGSKIAVVVDLAGEEEVAKDVAMHIAFAKPQYMTRDQFPADKIADERKILEARAAESGKPAEIVAKMVEGGINKFVAENTLMGQPFVKDDKQSVEKMLAARKAKLHGYRFLVVGQGIEKKQSDFAAEVAAMSKNAA